MPTARNEKYVSPYKERVVTAKISGEDKSFPIYIRDTDTHEEIAAQTARRTNAITVANAALTTRDMSMAEKAVDKLLKCKTEEEIVKAAAKGLTVKVASAPVFRYRDFCDVLKSKMPLVQNPNNQKICNLVILALSECCGTDPRIAAIAKELAKDKNTEDGED